MDKSIAIVLAAGLGVGLVLTAGYPQAQEYRPEAGSGLVPKYLIQEDFTEYPVDELWEQRLTVAPGWTPWQATGAPNTPVAGDIQTAWASKTQDGQDEWLELTYAQPIRPVAVIVFETYNPGALAQIVLFDESGEPVTIWGDDPRPLADVAKRVVVAPVTQTVTTDRVKLSLLSSQVPGWNEIDSVGLLDEHGRMHWAVDAKASSSYNEPFPNVELSPPQLSSREELRHRLTLLQGEIKATPGIP